MYATEINKTERERFMVCYDSFLSLRASRFFFFKVT